MCGVVVTVCGVVWCEVLCFESAQYFSFYTTMYVCIFQRIQHIIFIVTLTSERSTGGKRRPLLSAGLIVCAHATSSQVSPLPQGVTWCDVVWRGVVKCGIVWCGMVWWRLV